MTQKQQQGHIKLKKGLKLVIEAWEDLGLSEDAPEEFQNLKQNYKNLKEQLNGK